MRILELKIKNLRKISDVTLKFDKPLICLYGDVQQGKTTFLDAIKILFSSGFPADLIQHGQKEASIELILENGVISRSFYLSKENQIKGRALNAIVENKKLSAKELQKMFNPFQLNQDFLKEMTTTDRKKFFVELFNVDTKEIDTLISSTEKEASVLRTEVKSFGSPLEGVDVIEKPDIDKLEAEKEVIRTKLNNKVLKIRNQNKELKQAWQIDNEKHLQEIQVFNQKQHEKTNIINSFKSEFKEAQSFAYITKWIDFEFIKNEINKLPQPELQKPLTNLSEPEYITEQIDSSELDVINEKISNTKADLIRFENYQKALKKQSEKEQKQKELSEKETYLRDLRKQKIAKLSEYGKEVKGLSFNENGDLTFEGIANDNLSTSQIVRLGSELSKLYPNSLLDLELIDRGESLGKTIWNFIEKAKKEDKTILATIVGEKPAKTPEDVGVFVVENGELL